jgi:RNA polymerase-binding protein DksA
MATSSRRSLVSRAGAAARKVVARKPAQAAPKGGAQKSAAQKSAATKSPAAKKTAAKASPAAKTAAVKSPSKKTPAKKSPATKTATTKTATKKTATKKTATKKTVTKKTAATKSPAKKASAEKAPATAPAKKAAPKKTPARKAAPTKTAKKTAPATRTAATPVTGKADPKPASPGSLVVRADEDPWTREELAEVKAQLKADVKRLTDELEIAEEDLAGLMRSSGEGAGNDQADVGSASYERDQELTIANNARDMLLQSQHALDRIADGSYGVCEVCGEPIGKNRLMVFPRATMCLSCKQREERR